MIVQEWELDAITAVAICAAIFAQGTAEPQVTAKNPRATDWTIWGVAFAPVGLQVLSYTLGVDYPEAAGVLDKVQSVVLALCSIAIAVVAFIAAASKSLTPDAADLLAYFAVFLANLPGMVNPLKYVEIIGLLVSILDIFGAWGSAACGLIAAGLNWDDPVGVALT